MPRRNYNVQFEEDLPEDDFRPHTGIHVSSDGRRAVTDVVNVCPQKKPRREPATLEDTFATWTPVDDNDMAEVHAFADTVTSYDVTADEDDGTKRKRYQSSVSFFFFLSRNSVANYEFVCRMTPGITGVLSTKCSSKLCFGAADSETTCLIKAAPAVACRWKTGGVFSDAFNAEISCNARIALGLDTS
jgi:hypothetical protein